jgi:hypothetical protein
MYDGWFARYVFFLFFFKKTGTNNDCYDQIAAQGFLQRRQYGLAISYLTSAENWTGLGHVVDKVLNEFLVNGRCFDLLTTLNS